MKRIGSIVRTVAVGVIAFYLALAAVLYVSQRSYIYFPDTQKPDFAAAHIDSLQQIALATADGLNLLAWYLPPQPGKPIIVYFHGNAGNLSQRIVWLDEFAKAGYGVLMPEYRGYGGNPGEPTEKGLFADADAAMAFVKEHGFMPERTIVYGESLGTGVATRIAAENRVAALVLEAPYTSLTTMAAQQFSYLPVSLLLKDRFDSLSRIGRVHAPLLIIQGARDETVPPALGRQLFAAASEPKEIWTAPEGGHVNLLQFGAAKVVLDFLNRQVPKIP